MEPKREVTLMDMLTLRERRVERINTALKSGAPALISFTMNIPGPVKNSPLIRRSFREGQRRLEEALGTRELSFTLLAEEDLFTGCEALYAVAGDARTVKGICAAVENGDELSRLYDMDVMDRSGRKLERGELSLPERGCMVCGAEGRGCASRRVHTVEELQAETHRRMAAYFSGTDRRLIERLAEESLIAEVWITPKPGLVDRANTGSHTDMDLPLFEKSAAALTPFWGECFAVGRDTAQLSPEDTFFRLRGAGLAAERAMFAATNGVNTHKGAVFLLGILCGAIGRLWDVSGPRPHLSDIFTECKKMTAAPMAAEFSRMGSGGADTAGGRLYLSRSLRGARGEAADGFPSVSGISLPTFRDALARGIGTEHAAAAALLHLIALGTDTNMHHRGGVEGAAWGAAAAARLVADDRIPTREEIAALDREFIQRNLSPGGCADLLAVTLFLHRFDTAPPSNRNIKWAETK